MRKADGYASIVGDIRTGEPTVIDLSTGVIHTEAEVDTFVCGHCQRAIHVKPYQDAASVGGGCRLCQRNICPKCVDRGLCDPWEEMIARMEDRGYG